MSTTVKNKKPNAKTKKANITAVPTINPIMEGAQQLVIPIESVDYGNNYRKYFSEEALNAFAAVLKQQGIIQPLTVRPKPQGRYELVSGERRYRGALIAGLNTLPVQCKELTDEEVNEIQLSENLQREDPHPMNDAQGIGQMMSAGHSIEEIHLRLGKSKQFVYSRIKLLSLIEPIREMFIADVWNVSDAFEIAALSEVSQTDFFNAKCCNWKEREKFSIYDLKSELSRFKYDLNRSPFNPADAALIPNAGACTACPFNTATLETLFPDMAKKATCSNKQCYQQKCTAHLAQMITKAIADEQPQAFVFYSHPSETLTLLLDSIDGAAGLPQYMYNTVEVINRPVKPEMADFENEDEQDEEWEDDEREDDEDRPNPHEDREIITGEAAYQQALAEYQTNLEEYEMLVQEGRLLKGLAIREKTTDVLIFRERLVGIENSTTAPLTAKEVQEAEKAGTATPELYQAEIKRIQVKENRAKELDREKVQLNVHTAFASQVLDVDGNQLTPEDLVTARLLIYQSLDYSSRNKVEKELIPPVGDQELSEGEHLYNVLSKLTDVQYSYLIRMAIAGKSESKSPTWSTGYFLYRVAAGAGVAVDEIEAAQQQKAEDRERKQTNRIEELELKIDRINKARAAFNKE